jgi:hypothetical protein
MRNGRLHGVLAEWVQDACTALSADADGGAEIDFDVLEAGREGGTPLYCYRPLTDRFVADREELVATLPAAAAARDALERVDGLERYLLRQGQPDPGDTRGRTEAAAKRLLARAMGDGGELAFSAHRFDRAYAELEEAVYAGRSLATIVAPIHGLTIESAELLLADGVRLVPGDAYPDAPPDAVRGAEPPLLAVFERPEGGPEGSALTAARTSFRRLQTALRLWDTGPFALGPVAWARIDGGTWRLTSLGGGGRPTGLVVVAAAQEDELRAFCSLVARRTPQGGELAWALRRFEMGCERANPLEALTDHLLALRALLEPEGPTSGRLAQRLAVLCAKPSHRATMAEVLARAVALERAIVTGLAPPDSGGAAVIAEVTRHLRALLRDVICGHLESDLVALADELLAEAAAAEPAPKRTGLMAGWTVSAR